MAKWEQDWDNLPSMSMADIVSSGYKGLAKYKDGGK